MTLSDSEIPGEHPRWPAVAAFVLPLIARGRSIGTVALGSAIPGRYSTDDATLLQQVAGQVALAVANMTAYEEIATLKAKSIRKASPPE